MKIIIALGFILLNSSLSFGKTDEIIVLPNGVVGKYLGTAVWGKDIAKPKISQQTTAVVIRNDKMVSITFSGGTPGVDASTPQIKNFQFRMTPGSQTGCFESVKMDASQAGVNISSYLTNMNIENLYINGVRIEFTGTKVSK